jgi:putative hemolysin
MRHQIARDISYASAAASRPGRAVIRTIENISGRLSLIRRAEGYHTDVANGRDFWSVLCDRYGLSLDVVAGTLQAIPASGPLIVVANHPYGVLDGLMMGRILSERRNGDFRVLANAVFRRSPDLDRVILPISFDGNRDAQALNLKTRAAALTYLTAGGAIGIFPGGTVSTAVRPLRDPPMDPVWRTFTARMIARSGATVVPVFFDGRNSRLFQLASHIHTNLRLGMLLREFRARTDAPVRVVIGQPVAAATIAAHQSDPKALMDFLRKATYDLSPRPIDSARLGHEFEARYRAGDGSRDF